MRKHTTTGCPVTCECGKLVAVERNGRFFVKCKGCGRQVEIFTEELVRLVALFICVEELTQNRRRTGGKSWH